MSQPSKPAPNQTSTSLTSTTPATATPETTTPPTTLSDAWPAVVVHEHREVYQGRVFTLAVDRVTLPTGHTATMDIVRHPGSVVMLPMPAPDRLVLIRQYRYAVDRFIWEVPAGSLEPGEDPDAAAARECEEEIGLVPSHVERIGTLLPTPGFCDEVMHFYRCTGLREPGPDSTAEKDEDEVIEPRTFTLDEVRRMIAAGEVLDMKTVAGLALLR